MEIPFIENPNDRCVPATIGMVLAYFMPEQEFTMAQLEKLCGYKAGRGCWQTQAMLSLADIGFEVCWVEDFNHHEFIADPKGYLRTLLDDKVYEWQLGHSDLSLEAQRMKEYLDRKLPLERRAGTRQDIQRLIDDGWLVRLEVNSRPLAGHGGYDGHSVLVIGYDNQSVTIHNPDGVDGNKPNQLVSWELLEEAWREFGGSFSLYGFRLLGPDRL